MNIAKAAHAVVLLIAGLALAATGCNKQNADVTTAATIEPDHPIDPALVDLLEQGNHGRTLADLLSQHDWIGTNASGVTLLFKCGEPAEANENSWVTFTKLDICDASGKTIFFPVPSDIKPFRDRSGHLLTREELENYFRPQLSTLGGATTKYHFRFVRNFVPDKNAPAGYGSYEVKGRFVSTNLMIINFPETALGRVYFSPKSR